MQIAKKICFFLSIYWVCFCAYVTVGQAAIVNVADYGDGTCSLANAQSANNDASAGDTIVFPAGNCTWSSGLSISKPLSVIGAGSGAGGTKLTSGGVMVNGFFYINGFTSSNVVRISGFNFELTDITIQYRAIEISDVSLDRLRIDHNKFSNGFEQIKWGGSNGVIDHNYFYNPIKGIEFSAGTVEQANASWDSMAAGTGEALFIEDNYFIDDSDYMGTYSQERIATFNGGKLVIRYNHFNSYNFPLTSEINPIMAHGSAAAGVPNGYWQQGTGARRGQSIIEIYENIMEGKRVDWMAILRGSSSLIFNNTLISLKGGVSRIQLREEEYNIASNWNPLRIDWPAEDQVHNTFIWGNTFNGIAQSVNNIAIVPDDPSPNEKIKKDRDYFLHEPQPTGGKETFTGANGASGSYPTDGSTYPTLGTMVFLATGANAYYPYTPYTYPHPLTVVSSQQNVRSVAP